MKNYPVILATLLMLARAVASEVTTEHVTLLQVLARPEKYDGKEIQIIGYLRLEFEGNCLYLHKEDYDHAIIGNDIWVDVTEKIERQKRALNDRYVIIQGIFDAKRLGHMGLSSGTLKDITRCDAWGPGVDHGLLERPSTYLVIICLALASLGLYFRLRRKGASVNSRELDAEPSAPPNGGPATRYGDSEVAKGPPSVS